MHIHRLQVEPEGFLGGLDVTFSPGLNVLVGARGTGKTSIIELIRWCLNAPGFTRDAAARGEQQSLAILAGAAATVTVEGAGGFLAYTRSERGSLSRNETTEVTVLAQNEIETLGAQAAGRLFLIDRFWANPSAADRRATALRTRVRSMTAQVQALAQQAHELREISNSLEGVTSSLAEARREQSELLATARATHAQQQELSSLDEERKLLAARLLAATSLVQQVTILRDEAAALHDDSVRVLLAKALEDLDDTTQASLSKATSSLAQSRTRLAEVVANLNANIERLNVERSRLDEAGRALRERLDVMQTGLGSATRKVQDLEEQAGQVEATRAALGDLEERISALVTARARVYDDMDDLRQEVFDQRAKVVADLNRQLLPQVRVRVEQARQTTEYESAIVSALKGSGLRYNSLAPAIARAASPYELAIWAERGGASELASAAGITPERAMAVLVQIQMAGTEEILASRIEDEVIFELLDGRDYKPSDRLSIGQRCTVVLPILLSRHGSPLLIDQPEDHLDNAFIAHTLVKALKRRRPEDQYIFVSHNANIPVLAEADNVIVMASDGDRGYTLHQGPLDDQKVVEAITSLMEGGREAFRARARFYGDRLG